MVISFLMSVLVILVDQITKFLVYGTASRSIIGNLLWFESALNTGVAFSMFQNASGVFIVTSSLAVLVFAFLIISKKFVKYKSEKICLGFILGGTLSNLIDRIIFGGVRDFIYLKFINFAIFNIADMAISFGVIALCIFILIIDLKRDKNEKLIAESETKLGQNKETTIKNEMESSKDEKENNLEAKNIKEGK